MDQRDGYARTDQPRLPERAVACMDAGSAAVRALGPEMTQRMCSEANPNHEGAKHLYDLILNRYRSSSFVITSNRAVDEWLSLFDDPILGNSALDRLANASYQIAIEGTSYRERLSPHRALLGAQGGD